MQIPLYELTKVTMSCNRFLKGQQRKSKSLVSLQFGDFM